MTSAVCTLFEGDYHFGVAALVNSLYSSGFRGTVYAGYRGALPCWANHDALNRPRGELVVREGLLLRFVTVETTRHLTNYKPEFMLQLWQAEAKDASSLFYFDPDITIRGRWSFFENWVRDGVAVCEDVNGSMPDNHPIRNQWRREFANLNVQLCNSLGTYFNAGFVGLGKEHQEFLGIWRRFIDHLELRGFDLRGFVTHDRTDPFSCGDQDALNMAAMVFKSLCPMGQDGMDFQCGGGGYVMTHAIGPHKPWRNNMFSRLLFKGIPPSRADKAFFSSVNSPLAPYSRGLLLWKRASLKFCSGLGRFVS